MKSLLPPSLTHLAAWALGRRRRWRVAGPSMLPTYAAGEHVLVDPGAFRRRPPQRGDVVLARPPLRPDLVVVKRVRRVEPDGACFLAGDNPRVEQTTDSRSFGAVPADGLLGRVVARAPF